jgi:hypothetical protein
VEAEPETPKHYGIEPLPAVLCFHHGQVVEALTGAVERTAMVAKLYALIRASEA